ncbi:hypothetical protein Pmani_006964 [Petrolisthes manimaculis]|uniref:Uncharacterized protein n=1 Tax=Petrolisthes manimaculis TaxID=1843537 RepID=A0AAE1UFA5_9EUCA|nr:hypothetical protein Pmani_006964 [Petrolisthes manimaculis]
MPSSDGKVRDVGIRYKIQRKNGEYEGQQDMMVHRSVHKIDTGTSVFSLHSLLHLVSTGHPGTTIGGNVVGTHNGRINPVATYCFIPGA